MSERIPLTDWRDNLRGLPVAALTEYGFARISKGKDREAQSAIERLSDRPGPNRWSEQ